MRPLARPPRVPAGDQGFSLVEAVVALAIAVAIFTALAFALIGGARSALLSQQNQQAADVLNRAVEQARAVPYDSLAVREADIDAGETRSPALSTVDTYDPTDDSSAGANAEALVYDANGLVAPGAAGATHTATVAQNGGTFTVRRYVTVPADASTSAYKRLTIVVTWSSLGKERTRTYSTLVARTQRGLPLPDFKFSPISGLSQCRNPASEAVYSLSVTNNGARDAWSLTATAGSPTWGFFADTNADGAFDSLVDAPLGTTSGGTPFTGLLEPDTAKTVFAVATLQDAASRPPAYVLPAVFRATSVAQPTFWQELTTQTSVQATACGAVASPSPSASVSASPTPPPPVGPTQPAASCADLGSASPSAPGGTLIRYYMGNPSQPGDTASSVGMPVSRDAGSPPSQPTLYNLSTEYSTGVAGRYLEQGSLASTAPRNVASWHYTMPAASVLKGNPSVTFYATPASGALSAAPAFTVVLDILDSTGSVVASLGQADYTPAGVGWQCTGHRAVSLELPSIGGNGEPVAANQTVRVRVLVTNAVPVRLAYGTASYPMQLTLPYKSGLG